ncbi:hypothetical protein PCANC_11917 [Puccinia coronata f. sp. avenae]|uniref:Uncharacterized protein n=1 Tax=Puccinia coronata f. sp. avenae TaxID=200324 RepID=A0A2N5V608_9BASI|nr:hypothetical protein PCASD_18245 [Puccinia coronata f. sp. avenae]PLW14905.1 hypothetical protein PCANC_14787 [Puccinia coronata f. sp. avenae]PLW43033.1 hypothetical protein PCASD_06093 [Puccinia coronata f. sp. avenae]PLW45422.1 hypothetical protein PCANC_11917 [Puccinia coronata f. sp. avenae]
MSMAFPAEILITLGICRVGQPFHKRRSRRPSMINLLLPWGHFSSSYFQFFASHPRIYASHSQTIPLHPLHDNPPLESSNATQLPIDLALVIFALNSNTACSVTRTSCLVQLVFTSPRKFSLVHPNRNIGEACCLISS